MAVFRQVSWPCDGAVWLIRRRNIRIASYGALTSIVGSSYLAKVPTGFPSPFASGPKTSTSRGDEFGRLSEPRVASCRKNSPILSIVF
ncbi:hypothetical protein KL86PLE_130072 [uncultured Pleomorphomonas sp.]|uniref:Uncharacterized protein n=1 Tax=uncultured Pleomorphomonas sp. TaxID=442121 RepID=A0A212L949_9HYPH|nr:hypothetical protein KL86PLE_130072 [uncultured Pleomorphomonas sp.]